MGIKCFKNEIKNLKEIIILKNIKLPFKLSHIYHNLESQKDVTFKVYQGENKSALEKFFLDPFTFNGLRKPLDGKLNLI